MDLSIPIAIGTMIFGYYLNENGKVPRSQAKVRQSIIPNEMPTSTNTYRSVQSRQTEIDDRNTANARYQLSKDYRNTNIVPEILDCQYDCLGNEESALIPGSMLPTVENYKQDTNVFLNGPMFQQPGYLNKTYANTLSGENLEMKHGNMQPFFGSSVKQNTMGTYNSILEGYTGTSGQDLYQNKTEVAAMFAPQPESTTGTPLADPDLSRYNVSAMQNGVIPYPQIRDIPIDPEALRPQYKSSEQLNVKPRRTYEGDTVQSGIVASLRGDIGEYNKRGPDTAFEYTQNRWLTGSSIKSQSMRLNFANGCPSLSEAEFGVLAGAMAVKNGPFSYAVGDGKSDRVNIGDCDTDPALKELFSFCTTSTVTPTKRHDYNDFGNRNMNTVYTNSNEIQRCNTVAHGGERDTTNREYTGVAGDLNKGKMIYDEDPLRPTIKETNLYSYTGNPENESMGDVYRDGVYSKDRQNVDIDNYISNPSHTTQSVVLEQSYRDAPVKTVKQQVSDTKGYFTSIGSGPKISADADTIGQLGKVRNNKQSNYLGPLGAPVDIGIGSSNIGAINKIGHKSGNTDILNRIDPVLLDALNSNPYNRDILK